MNIRFGLMPESYKHEYLYDYSIYERKAREDKFLANKSIGVDTAKNDTASFQLLVLGDEAASFTIGDEAYFSTNDVRENVRIDVDFPLEIKLFHIGAVVDDDSIRKCDILLGDANVEMQANEPCCIWVESKIGSDVGAGEYNGTIYIYTHRMFEAEKLVGTLSFTVNVHNVTMPSGSERRFHLDLWQHNSNIARKHEVSLYSDRHFEILEKYVSSLGELGQSAITVIASEIPWSGQRCYNLKNDGSDLFEYSMIKVSRKKDGTYTYDFSIMQRYIDLCMKYGIDREIEVFGLCNIWIDDGEYSFKAKDYPEYIRVRYFDEAKRTYAYMDKAQDLRAYIKALYEYFSEKGYLDIVRVVADEPADAERYRKSLGEVLAAGPEFKFKTAVNHAEFIEEFKNQISDFVPGLFLTSSRYEMLRKMVNERTHRILWYVCCNPPIPNTYICSNLLESRAIGYLTKFMHFDGFLRWNYTVWPEDPRRDLRYHAPLWRCGDTNFVYPSRGGEVLLSIRYKALMRGILDYELLCMVEERGGKALVEEIIDSVVVVNTPYELDNLDRKLASDIVSLDYNKYDDAKKRMLAFLEK